MRGAAAHEDDGLAHAGHLGQLDAGDRRRHLLLARRVAGRRGQSVGVVCDLVLRRRLDASRRSGSRRPRRRSARARRRCSRLASTIRPIRPTRHGSSSRSAPMPTCATVLQSGYSDPVTVGSVAGWLAPSLADGTYAWRALAEDIVGNRSAWSAAKTLIVDTVAARGRDGVVAVRVGDPEQASSLRQRSRAPTPAIAARSSSSSAPTRRASTVLADGSSAVVGAGVSATWTPGRRPSTTARTSGASARSISPATSRRGRRRGASCSTRRRPAGRRTSTPTISGKTLTLSWRPPADLRAVRGYSLLVDGRSASGSSSRRRGA